MSILRAAVPALALWLCGAASFASPLRFSIPEGDQLNEFFRDGPVAAHLALRSGAEPRLVVAFPAGNSGAAMWFQSRHDPLRWIDSPVVVAAELREPGGAVLRGVTAVIEAAGGPVELVNAMTGSIRVIRDFEHGQAAPPGIETHPQWSGPVLTWRRPRLDGKPGYLLSVEALAGRLAGGDAGPVRLEPGRDGRIRLRVTALSGDTALTPLAADELLTDAAAGDLRLRQVLAFLSYAEKLLAGSWRFDTYFGRDTLMSVRLLLPVLRPQVVEAALESVLSRLSAAGEVAHEEDIGEFAVIGRSRARLPGGDAPLFDYRMIDDDYMLAAVAAQYLLDSPAGRARAAGFLARSAGGGAKNGAALTRNFAFVVDSASAFASAPAWPNLIALKPDTVAGNWRDSEEGLGRGRMPYDVNGVWVPAALGAIARLQASGLLDPYLDPESSRKLGRAGAMSGVWQREAPRLFDVTVAARTARVAVSAYAAAVGIDSVPALQSIGDRAIRFRAVALDGAGRPVPVLNSDESFALLFLNLPPAEVERIAATLSRPFPAGLQTPVGLLVANPAFAETALHSAFGRDRYHGAVTWSWQQAMFRAGLERQLARGELPDSTRAVLAEARDALRAAMRASDALRSSELWSWTATDGEFGAVPFSRSSGHETESNAAQLWSTVRLAWPDD